MLLYNKYKKKIYNGGDFNIKYEGVYCGIINNNIENYYMLDNIEDSKIKEEYNNNNKYQVQIFYNEEYYDIYLKTLNILKLLNIKHNNIKYTTEINHNKDIEHFLTNCKISNDKYIKKYKICYCDNLGLSYIKDDYDINIFKNVDTSDILYSQLDICDILQKLFENDYTHDSININNMTYTFKDNILKSNFFEYINLHKINNNSEKIFFRRDNLFYLQLNYLNNDDGYNFVYNNDSYNKIMKEFKNTKYDIKNFIIFINNILNKIYTNNTNLNKDKYNVIYSYAIMFFYLYNKSLYKDKDKDNDSIIFYLCGRSILLLLILDIENIDFNIIKTIIFLYLYKLDNTKCNKYINENQESLKMILDNKDKIFSVLNKLNKLDNINIIKSIIEKYKYKKNDANNLFKEIEKDYNDISYDTDKEFEYEHGIFNKNFFDNIIINKCIISQKKIFLIKNIDLNNIINNLKKIIDE